MSSLVVSILSKSELRFELLLEATFHQLLEPRWDVNLQLCDLICEGCIHPKFALENINRTLLSDDAHVVLLSIQVLESWVKNCGDVIRKEVVSKSFIDALINLLKSTNNENVCSYIISILSYMLKTWTCEFRDEVLCHAMQDAVDHIKSMGYNFPGLKDDDIMITVNQEASPDMSDMDEDLQVAIALSISEITLGDDDKSIAATSNSTAELPTVVIPEVEEEEVEDEDQVQLAIAISNSAIITTEECKATEIQELRKKIVEGEEKLQSIRHKVVCAVCMEKEKDNALVPCGHQFCRDCIDAMKYVAAADGTTMKCPICNKLSTSEIRIYL